MSAKQDANLLVFQYRNGYIPANVFADEMRALNYSTQQIMQIVTTVNNPRTPRNIDLPEPDGNVLPASQPGGGAPSTQPMTDEQRLNSMGITLPSGAATRPTPTPTPMPAPTASPETVALAREATARSEEGPTYGRPESALTPIPRSEDGPWYGRPEPSNAQRAMNIARERIPQPLSRMEVMGNNGGEPASSQPSGLMQFIRGDFREGADQRIMEAMRRQREESGLEPGKAEGGAATGKSPSGKDAVLHKALEIIHMMLSRR